MGSGKPPSGLLRILSRPRGSHLPEEKPRPDRPPRRLPVIYLLASSPAWPITPGRWPARPRTPLPWGLCTFHSLCGAPPSLGLSSPLTPSTDFSASPADGAVYDCKSTAPSQPPHTPHPLHPHMPPKTLPPSHAPTHPQTPHSPQPHTPPSPTRHTLSPPPHPSPLPQWVFPHTVHTRQTVCWTWVFADCLSRVGRSSVPAGSHPQR